jgi:hypothetical protein
LVLVGTSIVGIFRGPTGLIARHGDGHTDGVAGRYRLNFFKSGAHRMCKHCLNGADRSRQFVSCVLAMVVALGIRSIACGGTISFDPDGSAVGNSAYTVGAFDFAQASTLFQGIGNLTLNPGVRPFTLYSQARLTGLSDANANPIAINGLNSAFEITMLMGVSSSAYRQLVHCRRRLPLI